jgi:NADH:ubiquinone oxidoreductase subunit E
MPKTEKIGSDVLDTEPPKTKYDKRKAELLQKAKEEIKKKKAEEEEEKLAKIPIPGEKVEGEQIFVTEAEAEAMAEALGLKGKDKEVYVREHFRSKPKKKRNLEELFDFP